MIDLKKITTNKVLNDKLNDLLDKGTTAITDSTKSISSSNMNIEFLFVDKISNTIQKYTVLDNPITIQSCSNKIQVILDQTLHELPMIPNQNIELSVSSDQLIIKSGLINVTKDRRFSDECFVYTYKNTVYGYSIYQIASIPGLSRYDNKIIVLY